MNSPIPYQEQRAEWKAKRDAMISLWNQGHSLAAIGRMFGISRERVRQIVNKAQRKGI